MVVSNFNLFVFLITNTAWEKIQVDLTVNNINYKHKQPPTVRSNQINSHLMVSSSNQSSSTRDVDDSGSGYQVGLI